MADPAAPAAKKPRMNDHLIDMMKANTAKNGLAGAKGAFMGMPYQVGGSPAKGGRFEDPRQVYGQQWAAQQAMKPTPRKPKDGAPTTGGPGPAYDPAQDPAAPPAPAPQMAAAPAAAAPMAARQGGGGIAEMFSGAGLTRNVAGPRRGGGGSFGGGMF